MIKRAIALLLLLGAGYLLLQLAIGDAAFGSPEAARKTGRGKTPQSAPFEHRDSQTSAPTVPHGAVTISGGNKDEKPVKAAIAGALDIKQRREFPLPNGNVLLMTLYRVIAEQSTPLSDDRYRLERVKVLFYELGDKGSAPKEELAGELRAATMLVTLGRDEQGTPSLRADKEMELFDAVLATNEHARAKDLELQMGHAFVLAEENGTRIRSATDDEPFVLNRKGDQPLTLTGRGAHAWLPAARRPGVEAQRRLQIRAVNDPELRSQGTRGESRISARGPMSYEEDLDRGSAHVLVEREVSVSDVATQSSAFGDRLEGWLVRGPEAKAEKKARAATKSGQWRRLEMLGTPCRVVTADAEVDCSRLTVLPGLDGEPALLTATGADPRIVQKDKAGKSTTVTARDGIRLLRIPAAQGADLRALGFPRSALGGRFGQIVWFDGPAQLVQDELTANADQGMTLLRGVEGDARAVLVGRGSVRITRGELQVAGNQGFSLATSGSDAVLTMASSSAAISARLPQNVLNDAAELRVTLRNNALLAFVASGPLCRIEADTAEGLAHGFAARIVALDPRSLALFGEPARIERASGETIVAPEVRIGRGSKRATVIEAYHGATIHVSALMAGSAGKTAQPIDLKAETVRLVPFLAPIEVRRFMLAPLGPGARLCAETALGSAWLFAEKAVQLDQSAKPGQQSQGEAHATGDHLALSVLSGTGQLLGTPARVTSRDDRGQQNLGEAPCLRIAQAKEGQIVRLLPYGRSQPRLLVGGGTAGQAAATPSTRLEVTCNGEITIDPERITFGGSGRVRSLLADGEPDPDGLALTAKHLAIERDLKTGEAKKLIAKGDVVILSNQVLARADEATLAPERAPEPGWCELRDTRGKGHEVTIELASGLRFTGPRIDINWLTGAYAVWRAGISGDPK